MDTLGRAETLLARGAVQPFATPLGALAAELALVDAELQDVQALLAAGVDERPRCPVDADAVGRSVLRLRQRAVQPSGQRANAEARRDARPRAPGLFGDPLRL